jgi:alkaline phosphatase
MQATGGSGGGGGGGNGGGGNGGGGNGGGGNGGGDGGGDGDVQALITSIRGDEYFIAWQQITQVHADDATTASTSDVPPTSNADGKTVQIPLPDVMFGGGRAIFTDASVDNRTLLQLAADRGCSCISTSAQLASVLADPAAHASAPLLGLFAENHMPYAIDKGDGPTLTDMVNTALAVLKAKGKPFVLFVEGSRIDHALHDNDAAAAAAEVLAYDDAFAAAVRFADGAKGSGSSSPTTVIRFV